MHPERCTIWCRFWTENINEPYFFEDKNSRLLTVNGKRYQDIIPSFLRPILEGIDPKKMWFEHD